ncbi:MAG: ABC transporter ATP-binding protein [Verrucomicrobiota bacterium]
MQNQAVAVIKQILKYTKYLKPYWKVFTIAFLCGLIYSVISGFGLPVIVEHVFKDFLPQEDETQVDASIWKILSVAAILPLVFIIRGVAGFFNAYLMAYVSWQGMMKLRDDIFRKLQELPMAYYDERSTGDILTRIGSDTGRVQNVVMLTISELLKQPFVMLSGLGALTYLSWDNTESIFFLGFLLAAVLFVIPVVLLRKKLKVRGRQLQENQAAMTQLTKENVDAVLEVRAFSLEKEQRKFFNERMKYYIGSELKLIKYQRMQTPIMEVMAVFIVAGLFVYGYYANIDYATFAAMGFALYMTFDPLKKILAIVNHFHGAYASFERIEQTIKLHNDIIDPPEPKSMNRAQGTVSFDAVSFSYKTGVPVLRDISVTIPAGEHCALVGPSGSGKSTFIKLIPRLYDPTAGTVCIDGVANKELSLETLRRQTALVSQNPVLFNTSLMENIRMGRPGASDPEVIAASQEAYAHEFITGFDQGYQSLAGENGSLLSGGQKQRIAIARAFLRDAPILLLDEATSALDAESEAFIRAALDKLIKNRTVITVAHRMSTFIHAERLLVFDAGQIIASGKHQELIETCEVYQKLVYAQSEGTAKKITNHE